MDLGENIVLGGIQPSLTKVYYFINTTYGETSNPHYHIAVPTNNGNYILMVMFTTQIDETKELYTTVKREALHSLIEVKKEDLCFLSQDSLLDCNKTLFKTKEELQAIISSIEYKDANLTEEFVSKIKEAISKSPLVRPIIKKSL